MKKLILLLATIIVATPLLGIPGNDGVGVSDQKARIKTYTTGAIDAMIIPVYE